MCFEFQEKEEKLDGDAALNKFFRDIYHDADEDTRRAMRKSFVRLMSTLEYMWFNKVLTFFLGSQWNNFVTVGGLHFFEFFNSFVKEALSFLICIILSRVYKS